MCHVLFWRKHITHYENKTTAIPPSPRRRTVVVVVHDVRQVSAAARGQKSINLLLDFSLYCHHVRGV